MQNLTVAPTRGPVLHSCQKKDIRLLYRVWREQIGRLEGRTIRFTATQRRQMLRDFCNNCRVLDRSCGLPQA